MGASLEKTNAQLCTLHIFNKELQGATAYTTTLS